MIKKRLIIFILAGLVLTACGGGGDEKSTDSNANPVDDPAVSPVAPPRIAGTKLFSLKLDAGVVKQISTGKTIDINVQDVNSGVLLVVE